MSESLQAVSFFHDVQNNVSECLELLGDKIPGKMQLSGLNSGKMLRSLLVQRLSEFNLEKFDSSIARMACTATELVHTASLCHDDIIDEAEQRRGQPTIWKRAGVPKALLVGDLLLVESFRILGSANLPNMVLDFAEKLKVLCTAEMNQEFHRGAIADEERWRSICCGKTGTLFAFPARWSCWQDAELSECLERTGMLLGCAYQMFDDILDVFGQEVHSGKSLGTDAQRNKLTIPGPPEQQKEYVSQALQNTLTDAYSHLMAWPNARQAIATYISCDMLPVFQTVLPDFQWSIPSLHETSSMFKV